ncbi:MAG TPA: zf-HC2 domain-containing protein [Thermoanaerobaculia bacterium]|nr:zf-HC2 domain-containing protein [Thermoanaerobaculia bacterium]
MNHADVEEQQIVDRYVRGTLPAEEAARFEEHYLSCPDCLDRLDLAESMKRGFQRAAGQDVARVTAARQLAVVAWLARLGRSRQAAVLAMALLVAVLLPWGLAVRRIAERDRELATTRAALEQERSTASSRGTAETERLRSELQASQRDLAHEKEQLAQARQPQGNVPILFLNTERGGASAGGPTVRLRLPSSPGWIVLALEIDPPHQPSYQVVLRDAGGREVWRGGGLRIDEREALSLTLPSSLLAPGDYTLAVEGLAPGRQPVAAGRFAFRVLPAV